MRVFMTFFSAFYFTRCSKVILIIGKTLELNMGLENIAQRSCVESYLILLFLSDMNIRSFWFFSGLFALHSPAMLINCPLKYI